MRKTSCFNSNIETNNHALWWDDQCELLKDNKYRHLRRFRKSDNEHDYTECIIARNVFMGVCKKMQIHFHQQHRITLVNSRSNPKEFWRLLKTNNYINSKSSETSLKPPSHLFRISRN